MIYKFIISIIVFSFFSKNSKTFREFNGGRFGYSYTTIKLYNDSTYYFTDWNHTSYSVQDSGKYFSVNDTLFLKSTRKSKVRTRKGREKPKYLFIKQPFMLEDSILQILPKNKEDALFHYAYYRYYENK